jgi:hypothetical protein
MDLLIDQRENIVLQQWGGLLFAKDISRSLLDEGFFSEYIITKAILILAGPWNTGKAPKTLVDSTKETILNVLFTPVFNPSNIPIDELRNRISAVMDKNVGIFEQKFKALWAQADILDYIAQAEWKYKKFTPDDRVYSIRFETFGLLPLIWFVVSVNQRTKTFRLHGWSLSLLSFFVKTLKIQDVVLLKRFGQLCLGYLLKRIGTSCNRLYYTPYIKDPKSTTDVLNALMDIAGYPQEDRVKVVQEEDVTNSLGEELYIEIDNRLRNAYDKVDTQTSSVKMCIGCRSRVGTHYTEEYGKGMLFCGEECLKSLF